MFEPDRDMAELAAALDQLHGPVLGRVFPHLAGAMHGLDMSFSQLVALYIVFLDGPQTISTLAAGADLTHNAASRMVDRLVQAGLFTRVENPQDRRQKRIELTAAGSALPPELRGVALGAYSEALAGVPPHLLERLLSVMREIEPHLPARPVPAEKGA